MTMKTTGFWIAAVGAAAAAGWFGAMEVNRGPAFKGENDAYERFSNALTLTDTLERLDVLVRLVKRLTPESLPGAVRAFHDDAMDVFNSDFRLLMWYWAKEDPRGMLREVQTWSEVRAQRMAAGEAVAAVLRQEGYDAARSLFDQLPTHQRDGALPTLVLAYLESGQTVDLVGLIESYTARDERELAAGIVVGQILYLNGPEALASWVESLPDGRGSKSDLKAVAYRAAQSELMRRDELPFLEQWLERIDQEVWAAGARRGIAVNLAKREPMKAIAWAQALPPERGRDEILSETLRAFASFDRIGALEWMRLQEPAENLDAGTARIAFEFARRKPEVALEMLERIRGDEMRENLRRTLSHEWGQMAVDRRTELLEKLERVMAASPAPRERAAAPEF